MLIWQADTKRSNKKNNPIPTGIIDPKAETYIPGWVNTLQRELVFPDDSVLKGTIGMVLLRRY